MELAAVYKKRQFNLKNLTTNSTLKQSKSIEISKDLVLILQIYRIYEKKGREESPTFFRKKRRVNNLPRVVQGLHHPRP
jgi:hypothetical protein